MTTRIFDPILSNSESADFEAAYFAHSGRTPRGVIDAIGAKIAEEFVGEFGRFLRADSDVLAVVGSGNNAADAMAFLAKLREKADFGKLVLCVPSPEKLREEPLFYFDKLAARGDTQIVYDVEKVAQKKFALAVEGLAGMSFKPPMRGGMRKKIEFLNSVEADVKVSIDLPAGLSDDARQSPAIFKADATYATAIAKNALFMRSAREFVGRVRYIDAGFFNGANAAKAGSAASIAATDNQPPKAARFIVRQNALVPLAKLRPSVSDKRSFGRLLIVSGSRKYAGAALLNARAAIRAGCGFVFACVPEEFKPAFCAAEPSVIWLGCETDESGALALENFGEINAIARGADALLCGSGLTTSRESAALVGELLKSNPALPAVLDADAISKNLLQSEAVKNRGGALAITPHEGEFLRIAPDASDESLLNAAKEYGCAVMLKSNITRVGDGGKIVYSTRGSPALARAGSGDILCAVAAALLANKTLFENVESYGGEAKNARAVAACAIAAQWLGLAAERTAARSGETPLASSDIIGVLPEIPAIIK